MPITPEQREKNRIYKRHQRLKERAANVENEIRASMKKYEEELPARLEDKQNRDAFLTKELAVEPFVDELLGEGTDWPMTLGEILGSDIDDWLKVQSYGCTDFAGLYTTLTGTHIGRLILKKANVVSADQEQQFNSWLKEKVF